MNDLVAVEQEIAGITDRMATDRTAYFRDEGAQLRLRDLYRLREGGKGHVDDSNDHMLETAPVSQEEFRAVAPNGIYSEYLRATSASADVLMRVPASERGEFVDAFNRLPADVVAVMLAVLLDRSTVVGEYCPPEMVERFRRYPGGGVVAEWGQDAPVNMGVVRAKLHRLMEALDEPHVGTFLDWLEGLSSPQAAAVYRVLA